jgi:hypothetical protein
MDFRLKNTLTSWQKSTLIKINIIIDLQEKKDHIKDQTRKHISYKLVTKLNINLYESSQRSMMLIIANVPTMDIEITDMSHII